MAKMIFVLRSGLKITLILQPQIKRIKNLLEYRLKKIMKKKPSLVKVVMTKPKTFPKTI